MRPERSLKASRGRKFYYRLQLLHAESLAAPRSRVRRQAKILLKIQNLPCLQLSNIHENIAGRPSRYDAFRMCRVVVPDRLRRLHRLATRLHRRRLQPRCKLHRAGVRGSVGLWKSRHQRHRYDGWISSPKRHMPDTARCVWLVRCLWNKGRREG